MSATARLKRRKVEDGAYVIVDALTGATVATVEEWGKAGYRWRVEPSDRSGGWDTNSITNAINALAARLR